MIGMIRSPVRRNSSMVGYSTRKDWPSRSLQAWPNIDASALLHALITRLTDMHMRTGAWRKMVSESRAYDGFIGAGRMVRSGQGRAGRYFYGIVLLAFVFYAE